MIIARSFMFSFGGIGMIGDSPTQQIELLQKFRDAIHQEVSVTTTQIFLYIATKGSVTSLEVQQALGLPPSTASRTLSLLSSFERGRLRRGVGLVDYAENAEGDRRLKRLVLSTKGKKLWKEVTTLAGWRS